VPMLDALVPTDGDGDGIGPFLHLSLHLRLIVFMAGPRQRSRGARDSSAGSRDPRSRSFDGTVGSMLGQSTHPSPRERSTAPSGICTSGG
jgi:hypothetical protein